MKNEELQNLKEKVEQLKQKRDKVLAIQAKIKELEETEEVKKYLELLELYEEKTTGRNKGIETYTDKKIIDIALSNVEITPDEEIYVYIGTYKINHEVDIVHGSNDYEVGRTNFNADYVEYENIESKYDGTVQIPYKEADEFERTHKVIFPKNIASRQRYFYDLQSEYFETMIFESPEIAKERIYKLIK